MCGWLIGLTSDYCAIGAGFSAASCGAGTFSAKARFRLKAVPTVAEVAFDLPTLRGRGGASVIRLERDITTDGRYVVWIAYDDDFPGCMAQGDTESEARAELVLARREWLRCLAEDGLLAESRSAGADVSYEDTVLA